MNVLELFAGSRSFSKVAEERGHNTFTSDYEDFDNIDYVTDILDFDINKVPLAPEVIWCSPPCTHFSVTQIGRNWYKDHTPKTSEARLSVKIVQKSLEIIEIFNPRFYFIENPRGKLRKLDIMKDYPRTTVCYCQYGENNLKPTDIWTNHLFELFNSKGWKPRPMCNYRQKNCKCHHEKAPRGSKTGIQGMKNAYERSKVPRELCLEILKSVEH